MLLEQYSSKYKKCKCATNQCSCNLNKAACTKMRGCTDCDNDNAIIAEIALFNHVSDKDEINK